ncbi:MAG: HD domain-containing protein [Candidatus Bathyarchaeota archaeon]|nr:MAG: HD domain-containing protein [Candidatus Bathyarchaeota archaeon]
MSIQKMLEFFETVGKLKTVKRSGWITQAGIDEPESVADHSFRCAILSMCICDTLQIDSEKTIRMLLLHDIQESLTGDHDLSAKKKRGFRRVKNEARTAIERILSGLPIRLRDNYLSLWNEYENRKTPEAIVANDIDKIEMVIQAFEYEKKGYKSNKFKTFWSQVQDQIKTPLIKEMFKLLQTQRKAAK